MGARLDTAPSPLAGTPERCGTFSAAAHLGDTIPMAKKSTRQVFHSVHRMGEWQVTSNKQAVASHPTQAACEADARERARAAFDAGGQGQAILHRADGVIKTEHTYGNDPESRSS